MVLKLPVEPYIVNGYHFAQRLRRRIILWATHLGDDVVAEPGTPVYAIGEGEVVWSEMRLGTSEHRNWGGLVIIKHVITSPQTLSSIEERGDHEVVGEIVFYSIYGHITNLQVKKGERVQLGQTLGVVAPGNTPENGMWVTPHLHFAIYTGSWREKVLPGYARLDDWLRLSPRRTRLAWWHNPRDFIEKNNELAS
jgi:murein DD-endopeptidase MepM/ murein hydrolase activator NlpD